MEAVVEAPQPTALPDHAREQFHVRLRCCLLQCDALLRRHLAGTPAASRFGRICVDAVDATSFILRSAPAGAGIVSADFLHVAQHLVSKQS